MRWGMVVDLKLCVGCNSCVIACKAGRGTPKGIFWNKVLEQEKGKFPNLTLSYLAQACNHCGDPSCIKTCPVNAITKRESDGIVIVNQESCLGKIECGSKCLKACPWDAPQFSNDENAKMRKCNLCIERLEQGKQTICVEACPMYALDVDSIEELQQKYGKILSAQGFKKNEKIDVRFFFHYSVFSINS